MNHNKNSDEIYVEPRHLETFSCHCNLCNPMLRFMPRRTGQQPAITQQHWMTVARMQLDRFISVDKSRLPTYSAVQTPSRPPLEVTISIVSWLWAYLPMICTCIYASALTTEGWQQRQYWPMAVPVPWWVPSHGGMDFPQPSHVSGDLTKKVVSWNLEQVAPRILAKAVVHDQCCNVDQWTGEQCPIMENMQC